MREEKKITNFQELLNSEYGPVDSDKRMEFEENTHLSIRREILKSARKEAKLTQAELADKTVTKRSFITKIENAKANIQLLTRIKIFGKGLNRRVGFTFLY